MDIHRHVFIEIIERLGIGGISAPSRNFAILNSSKFIVLLPEIGLQNLKSSKESQDIHIALGKYVSKGSLRNSIRFRCNESGARDRRGPQKTSPVSLDVPWHVSLLSQCLLVQSRVIGLQLGQVYSTKFFSAKKSSTAQFRSPDLRERLACSAR